MKKSEQNTAVLEVGTKSLRILVLDNIDTEKRKILATASVPIQYIKRGVISNPDELIQSIRLGLSSIQKQFLPKIQSIVIALSGTPLTSIISNAQIEIPPRTGVVDSRTLDALMQKVEDRIPASVIQNKKIVQIIPQEYRVDNKKVPGDKALGLRGLVLEMKALCVMVQKQHLENILYACEQCGLQPEDVLISHYGYAETLVKEPDRLAGVCVVNIGGDTTSVITYDEGVPLFFEVLPIGSQDITKDLALGLKVTIERAEQIKLNPSSELQKLATELTEVILKKHKTNIKREQRERALFMNLEENYHEVVFARLIDIFELVQSHLKKIKKDRLLPAGVHICGAGGKIADIDIIAKEILHLPVQIVKDAELYKTISKHKISNESNPPFYTPDYLSLYGTAVMYLQTEEPGRYHPTEPLISKIFGWFKQFLP